MKSSRARTILILIFATYLFANQTAVGWLYIIDGLLIGLYIVSFFYPRRMVHNLEVQRSFAVFSSPDDDSAFVEPTPIPILNNEWSDEQPPIVLHEAEKLRVSLELENTGRTTKYFLEVWDRFLPANVAERRQKFFITYLKGSDAVRLDYDLLCERRGLYRLPNPRVESAAPLGLFRRCRELELAQSVLVYPEYYELKNFPLRRPENVTFTAEARVGPGTDIYGTREYREGDSLRHIHWPSSARAQKLIVKEFEQVISTPITILLDLQAENLVGVGKHTTLEYAVKLAASVAKYATSVGHPVYLLADSKSQTFAQNALPWTEILDVLARVVAGGDTPLADLLDEIPPSATLFVPVVRPDEATLQKLMELRRRRLLVTAVLFDFASFGPYVSPEQEEKQADQASKPPKFGFLGPLLPPPATKTTETNRPASTRLPLLSSEELRDWQARLQHEGIIVTTCSRTSELSQILESFTSRVGR